MSKMVIDVPDDVANIISNRAVEAGYTTAAEYVTALLAADASEPAVMSDSQLESLLLQRLDAPDDGELTPEVFDEIRNEVRAELKKSGR